MNACTHERVLHQWILDWWMNLPVWDRNDVIDRPVQPLHTRLNCRRILSAPLPLMRLVTPTVLWLAIALSPLTNYSTLADMLSPANICFSSMRRFHRWCASRHGAPFFHRPWTLQLTVLGASTYLFSRSIFSSLSGDTNKRPHAQDTLPFNRVVTVLPSSDIWWRLPIG